MSHRTLSSTAFNMLLNVNMHLTSEMHTFQTNNPLGIVRVLRDIKKILQTYLSVILLALLPETRAVWLDLNMKCACFFIQFHWCRSFLIFNTWRKFELVTPNDHRLYWQWKRIINLKKSLKELQIGNLRCSRASFSKPILKSHHQFPEYF